METATVSGFSEFCASLEERGEIKWCPRYGLPVNPSPPRGVKLLCNDTMAGIVIATWDGTSFVSERSRHGVCYELRETIYYPHVTHWAVINQPIF